MFTKEAFRYETQCTFFMRISQLMFATGVLLPMLIAICSPETVLSPAVYNFFQIGGIGGIITFYFARKFGNSNNEESSTPTVPTTELSQSTNA